MITLLEHAAAAVRDDLLRASDKALKLLEWSGVTRQIAASCLNRRAVENLRARRPSTSREHIDLFRALADEMRPAGDRDQWPPLLDVSGMVDLLEQPPPMRLEGPDLVMVAAAAEELDRLRSHFLAIREDCPLWGEAAVQMASFTGVTGAVRRALDLDGVIRDSASPLLARLRRVVGEQERVVRQEVNNAMARARGQGWTTADEATLRGDRFCLPLRSGDSRKISGIVHDRSTSGATLFVEPASVVRLGNELVETRLEIAAEEARILFELNRAVEQAAKALIEAAGIMILVDETRAHLLWSRRVGGHRPRLERGGALEVRGGRHPLLLEVLGHGDLKAGRADVVALDLVLPVEASTLVISGPNAGGKSVTLKSIGMLCLLAQCGWDIPAREDTRLPLIENLLVDLGDDQSLTESLSSFSAHAGNLARFMAEAGEGTLVLCDEIGSGTDPQEGTALAFTVLERLQERGALTLASTHYGLLKAAVHQQDGMFNAAMDYDESDMHPLFTLRLGDPGASHAFDIAARMGFDEAILKRARGLAGSERVQIEQLLADLDRRTRDLSRRQQSLDSAAAEQERLTRELDRRLRGIKSERRDILEQARLKAEDLAREGRRTIERAVREIRSSGADKQVVRSARERLVRLQERLPSTAPNAAPPRDLAIGQRVRIPHLGLTGVIVEIRGDKLTATAEGMRLNLTRNAVQHLDESVSDQPDTRPVDFNWSGTEPAPSQEIDLRGETGEEGWQRLDMLIDRAIPAGLTTVNVIHGFGTGRLRDYLHARLRSDARVASFADAPPSRGGAGVTCVRLAD